jgi:hypothetical protein
VTELNGNFSWPTATSVLGIQSTLAVLNSNQNKSNDMGLSTINKFKNKEHENLVKHNSAPFSPFRSCFFTLFSLNRASALCLVIALSRVTTRGNTWLPMKCQNEEGVVRRCAYQFHHSGLSASFFSLESSRNSKTVS